MSKQLTYTDIYSIYSKSSKKIVSESKILKESGFDVEGIPVTKCILKAYFDDIDLVPTTFQLDFLFKVVFDSAAIRERFSEAGKEDSEVEEPIIPQSDDETELQIQKAMTTDKPSNTVTSTYVDYQEFYWDVLRKNLSPYAVENKVRDLSRAGVFQLGDFKTTEIIDATVVDLKVLFRTFATKDKKNKQSSPIEVSYGYSVSLESTNPLKKYSQKDCLKVIEKFAKPFEDSILAKTEFYDFKK